MHFVLIVPQLPLVSGEEFLLLRGPQWFYPLINGRVFIIGKLKSKEK